MSIFNSTFEENLADINGGAICFSGNLNINNSTFNNNQANRKGGALYNNGGTSTIIDSTLDNNTATENGGAIGNSGTLTINNCTLKNNHGNYGGAIESSGTLNVNDTLLKDNNARNAGAIAASGTFTLSNSTLDNNTATQNGGAVQNYQSSSTITNITFNNNHAVKGGAIYNFYGKPNISNVTLDNNNATQGGAIYNEGGGLTLSDSTITNSNATEYGGAVYNYWGTLTIRNSTLKRNSATDGGAIYNGKTLSISDTLLENNAATENGGAIYNIETLTVNNITFNNNSAAQNGGAIYNNGTVTITVITLYNNNEAKNGRAIFNTGTITISNSILNNFTTTTGKAIYNNGTITINNTTISNNTSTQGGALYNNGILNIIKSTLNGNIATETGGAVYNDRGTLTIDNSELSNNTATEGGAIYNTGTLNIIQSTIYNNTANYAGAILNIGTLSITGTTLNSNTANEDGGAILNRGTLTVTGTTLNSNNATRGGAISNYDATANITGTSINDNKANYGGAIYANGTINIIQGILGNNTAEENGGAIHIYRGTVNINGTILDSNNATDGAAIFNDAGTVNINNGMLSNNRAIENGGAISNNGTLSVNKSRLNNNNATAGGAIFNYGGEGVELNVDDTIFTENHASIAAAIFSNNSYTTISIINNTFTQNTADNRETLVIQGEKIQKDNTYNSTDILLNDIKLVVKDNQEMFRKGEEEVLNFTIEIANPSYYDEDILERIEDLTIYINDERNATTCYANYTLRILQPDNYEIYFTSCNYESNHVSFIVEPNDSQITSESSYDYYEGVETKITINITDYSQKGGTLNLYVKEGDDYILLSIYPNVKDRKLLSTNTLAVALEDIYDNLDSSYVINLTYTSNFVYVTPSSTEFTFNVIKQRNTSIIYDIINNTEKNVQINITVIDAQNHSQIEEAVIEVTGAITSSMTSGILTDTALTPGNYTIDVKFNETSDYKASEATIDFTVEIDKDALIEELEDELDELLAPKETTISLNPLTDAKYNSNVTISGTLISEGTNGLFDQMVTLTVDGSEVNVTTVGGLFEYSTIFKSVGKQTVTARFAGTDKYKASNATLTFTVNKKESEITINDIASVTCNDNVTIKGSINSVDGTPLGHVNVYLYYNGEEQHITTYKDGVFKTSFATSTVGNQEVLVVYKGNTKFLASNATATFTTTGVKLVMYKIKNATYRDQYTVRGKLTDYEGNAIAGAEVQLAINDDVVTVNTDSNGAYVYQAKASKACEFTVTASYDGGEPFTQVTVSKTLTVNKRPVTLTLEDITDATVGNEVTVTGKLTDLTGTLCKNCKILVKINSVQQQVYTDNQGIYTCTYIPTSAGTYNVTVTYKGNSNYLGDKKTTLFRVI